MVHIFSPCFCAECFQLGPARHFAVVAQDFADHRGGLEAGESAEIHASFGLSGANQHAAIAGTQRVDMPGPQQILRLRIFRNGHLHVVDRSLALDAGCHAKLGMGIDGDGERGAEMSGVGLVWRVRCKLVALLAVSARQTTPRAWRI